MKITIAQRLLVVAPLALLAASAQAAITTIPLSALSSSPGAYTPGGYYTSELGSVVVMTGGGNAANVGGADGRNDDGFSALALGFSVSFFGNSYNSLFLNNNGNISFGNGISAFVPTGPTGATRPVISAWFGDVDTRGAASGVMHLNTAVANQIVVTWDRVGRFNRQDNLLNSFQIVLRGTDYLVPDGEGSIGFFYQAMQWEATGTSTTAAVGFGDGVANGDSTVLEGSAAPGLNAKVANQYIWFDAGLAVVPPTPPSPVPEPASWALVGLALLGAGFASRKRKA